LFLKTDGAGNLSFDSLSFATPLAVIGNATAGSEIRLPEDTDNGSNYVALKAPDTLSADLTLTLPSADGSSGQVLQTNGSGVLSFAGGGGISEADSWRLTTDFSSDAEITTNLERVDTYGNGYLGTGMTQSSGVFTFPSTGYWLVMAQGTIFSNQYGNTMLSILVTTDNSTYNSANQIRQGNANYGVGDEPNSTGSGFSIIDVTSTTNVKVKFRTNSFGGGSTLRGNTNTTVTGFSFIRLGDT